MIRYTTLLLSLLAVPALADTYHCTFTTECYANDACEDTAWEVDFAKIDAGTWLMSDITGERSFVAIGNEDGHRAWVMSNRTGSVALFTISANGIAQYSQHMLSADVQRIAYQGTCEEQD